MAHPREDLGRGAALGAGTESSLRLLDGGVPARIPATPSPPAVAEPPPLSCRFCGSALRHPVADLGRSPLANAFLRREAGNTPEPHYPLRALVCEHCFLVQVGEFAPPTTLFADYPYFSSCSESWLRISAEYARQARDRFRLDRNSLVIEVASNDGYLLQYFDEMGIPCLGIEPAANVARQSIERGIPTRIEFFDYALAQHLVSRGVRADLLVGINVLAHVPDLNDFVAGLAHLVADNGVVHLEFPHLLRLLAEGQFDTIYHEHFSYFSLYTVRCVLARHGLQVFDVERRPTHGGSLRVFASPKRRGDRAVSRRVVDCLAEELSFGLLDPATYARFQQHVDRIKHSLLRFLLDARADGRTVWGYGAPAKGNTLLNYCGIKPDLLPYTVDISRHKQGTFLPGTGIPVLRPDDLVAARPDYVLILPWNLKEEIMQQMRVVREWGGRFAIAVPELRVL